MRWAACWLALACFACGSVASSPSASSSPAATPSSGLGVYQLKFSLMDALGKPVYCDPDFYPVARADGEQASALATYPVIQSDPVMFAAIVAHENLPATNLTDQEKLTLYRAWKLLRALTLTAQPGGYSFQYRVAAGSSFEMVAGTISADGRISVASRTPTGRPVCPVCLAADTLIATPHGEVRVTDVRPGMVVWTTDGVGDRVAASVVAVGSTPVPAGHLMVHLVLADGREVLASPGHRAADGRPLGSLAAGEELDGSTIVTWELVPYSADRTYDLLPGGPTGDYWAGGILLQSTLKQ